MSDTDQPDSTLLDRIRELDDRSRWVRLLEGLFLPFRAAWFILKHHRLWLFIIVPAIINIGLFGGALYMFLTNADTIVDWIWMEPIFENWPEWIRLGLWYLLLSVVCLLSFVAAYVFILLVAGIVASPFNDFLSDHAERRMLETDELPEREESIVWTILRSIGSSLFVLGSYCVVMAPILLLNLVPALGQVAATILGAGVSSLFLTMEFTEAPLDRRGRGLRERFELIEGNRDIALGFGLGTSFLMWIPVFNLLTVPFAVVGGTILGLAMYEWERAEHY
jgi:CysZ protein